MAETPIVTRIAPVSLVSATPPAVSDFNWEAGIQFTPGWPAPEYRHNGRNYRLGELVVDYVTIRSSAPLEQQARSGVVYQVLGPAADMNLARLQIELPPEPATYLFSLQLRMHAAEAEELRENGHMYLTDESNDRIEVPLTPLGDLRGFTGIHQINPSTTSLHRYHPPSGMRHVSCRIDFEYHGRAGSRYLLYSFFGFCIMRL